MRTWVSMVLSAAAMLVALHGAAQDLLSSAEQAAGPMLSNLCGNPACRGCAACCPKWTVTTDALFLFRSSPNNASLLNSYPGGAPLYQAQDMNFGVGVGWDLGLKYHWNSDWTLEGRIAQVDDMVATSGTVNAPQGFLIPFVPPIVAPIAATMNFEYQTEFKSVEFNARHNWNERIVLLAGMRYLSLNDTLVGMSVIGGTLGAVGIQTINDMIGGQIGIDGTLWERSQFQVNGLVKAGGYLNNAVGKSAIFSGPAPVYQAYASTSQMAFESDLTIEAKYYVRKGIALRAGYTVLWFDGLAAASDQLATTDIVGGISTVNVKSSPILHGAFAGAEFVW